MKAKRKARPTAENAIKTASSTRRDNLRALIGEGERFPMQLDLANALGVTNSYLSQLIGAKPIKRVTETTARKFEYKLGLATGALDVVGC